MVGNLFFMIFSQLYAMFYCQNLIILGFSGAFAFPFNFLKKHNIQYWRNKWKKVRGNK